MSDWEMVSTKKVFSPTVCIYENGIKNIEEIIEASELINKSKYKTWQKSEVTHADGSVSVDKVRTNEVMYLSTLKTHETPLPESLLNQLIHEFFLPCVLDFSKQFKIKINYELTSSYQLLKYTSSQFYVSHCDDSIKTPRSISAIGYLNDNYTGGELNFDILNYTYVPRSGDIVVFPSGMPFSHEAKPVEKGTKYSIVNWW